MKNSIKKRNRLKMRFSFKMNFGKSLPNDLDFLRLYHAVIPHFQHV